jgi:tetratricopeptide (TPR) repeat protein
MRFQGLVSRGLLIVAVFLFAAGSVLAANQDLQKQKQQKLKEIQRIDRDLQSATPEEYKDLMAAREKVVAEIKEIDQKLMADADAMKKINAVKKAFNEGLQAYKVGQNQAAATSCDKAIELDSTFYQAYYVKGLAMKKMRDFNGAIAAYQGAIRQNPGYVEAYDALGSIYRQTNQADKAISVYKNALENDPSSAKIYYGLGAVYQNNKRDYNKAVENFRKATQFDAEYDLAYYSLGVSLTELGKFNEAIMSLEQALAVTDKRNWADANYRLSVAYNKLGNCSEALSHAETAMDQKKRHGGAAYEAGKASVCLGNEQKALGYFELAKKDKIWKRSAEYEIDLLVNKDKYSN